MQLHTVGSGFAPDDETSEAVFALEGQLSGYPNLAEESGTHSAEHTKVDVVSGWLETRRLGAVPVDFASVPEPPANRDTLEEFQEELSKLLEEYVVLETDCEEWVEVEEGFVEHFVECEIDMLEPEEVKLFTPTGV